LRFFHFVLASALLAAPGVMKLTAKAAKIEVELKPCKRVMVQVLRYEPR
jgi:hypothetical protein